MWKLRNARRHRRALSKALIEVSAIGIVQAFVCGRHAFAVTRCCFQLAEIAVLVRNRRRELLIDKIEAERHTAAHAETVALSLVGIRGCAALDVRVDTNDFFSAAHADENRASAVALTDATVAHGEVNAIRKNQTKCFRDVMTSPVRGVVARGDKRRPTVANADDGRAARQAVRGAHKRKDGCRGIHAGDADHGKIVWIAVFLVLRVGFAVDYLVAKGLRRVHHVVALKDVCDRLRDAVGRRQHPPDARVRIDFDNCPGAKPRLIAFAKDKGHHGLVRRVEVSVNNRACCAPDSLG